MRRELSVPFVDSRADQLAHSLHAAHRPALQHLALEIDGLDIELRILGSSHQVLVGGLSSPFVETVACGASDTALPDQLQVQNTDFDYHFSSRVDTHASPVFVTHVDDLLDRLEGSTNPALVGVFPGDRLAVTALQVSPDSLGWKTWHCYPNTGEIVTTDTRITR